MYRPLVAFAAIIIGVTLLMATLAVGAHFNRYQYMSPAFHLHSWLVALVLLVQIVLGAFIIHAIW